MAGELHAETLRDRPDDLLERVVGEGANFAAGLVDEVVMVPMRIGDLVACDAVAPVEAMQEAELEELVERAVDRGRRADVSLAEPVDDLVCGEQALCVASQQLDHGGAGGARSSTWAGELPIGPGQPAVVQGLVHRY